MKEISRSPDTPPRTGSSCPACHRSAALCLCGQLKQLDNETEILILQHPQEQDRELGTAGLAQMCLKKCTIRAGLSWPNLDKALGRKTDRSRWGVMYLGPIKVRPHSGSRMLIVDKKGSELPDSEKQKKSLEGIVVLDGTWSQAKTLWWRNAWLLKLKRVVLLPGQPSLYGKLRKEPRKDSVSTIESIAIALEEMNEKKEVCQNLTGSFKLLLSLYRGKKQ